MIELCGLWLEESADGNTKYFTGKLGHGRVVIFKNKFKEEGTNKPDYIMYLDEVKKKEVPKLADVAEDDVPF